MRYDVPLIPQTALNSCWAASIAMILGWKDQASYPDRGIAANAGGIPYLQQMQDGLDPNDAYILRQNGFSLEAPQCYTPAGIYMLLNHYGPLWFASSVPGAHIRVITGMESSSGNPLVYVNDPWEKGMAHFRSNNRGSQYSMKFNSIMNENETLGSMELSEPSPVYVAHLF